MWLLAVLLPTVLRCEKRHHILYANPRMRKKTKLKIYWTHLQNLIQVLEVQGSGFKGSEVQGTRPVRFVLFVSFVELGGLNRTN